MTGLLSTWVGLTEVRWSASIWKPAWGSLYVYFSLKIQEWILHSRLKNNFANVQHSTRDGSSIMVHDSWNFRPHKKLNLPILLRSSKLNSGSLWIGEIKFKKMKINISMLKYFQMSLLLRDFIVAILDFGSQWLAAFWMTMSSFEVDVNFVVLHHVFTFSIQVHIVPKLLVIIYNL